MIGENGPGDVTLGPPDRARALAAVKAVLRVASGDEDDLIVAFAETALGLAERFTGRVLIARALTETLAASAAWQSLEAVPVASIGTVASLDAAGTAAPLPAEGYAIDIAADGTGWLRVAVPTEVRRVAVTYIAGAAASWDDIPAPIRQGACLLAAHLYTERDEKSAPPAAVTALWRPFRRVALAGAVRC